MRRRSARLAASDDSSAKDLVNTLGSAFIRAAPVQSNQTSSSDDQDSLDKPFDLLGLPAEIRNRIYGYAFSNIAIRDLSQTRIPPIALASHQLRDEALPVLFASSPFRLTVGNNFEAKAEERQYAQQGRFHYLDQYYLNHCHKTSGTIGMKRIIGSFLKAAGNAALFRDITFEVFDSEEMREVRDWEPHGRPSQWGLEDRIVVRLHLEVNGGSLQVSIVKGRNHAAIPRPYPGRVGEAQIVRDVDDSVDKAINIAQGIADQDGEFKGFKMSDLRKIATAFRLE